MSNLIQDIDKTKFNEKQIGSSKGTDKSVVAQTEAGGQVSNSSSVKQSERSLTGKSVQTSSSKERYAIGVRVSFTVPIRSTTPVDTEKC